MSPDEASPRLFRRHTGRQHNLRRTIPKSGRNRRCVRRQCNPRWLGRTANSASSGRATSGFADPTTAPTSRPSALHTFDYGQSCKSVATPTRPIQRDTWRPDLKRLPWSVTCLSPMRQGELLATQNPDGSLVFSAVLKDEQGLLSFLLVPPSPFQRTPPGGRRAAEGSRLWGSRRPVGRRLAF